MNQGIDGTESVWLERQTFQQFWDKYSMVGKDGIVSQSHLRMLALDFGNGDVSHFATSAAGGGHDDEFFFLHNRDFPFEGICGVIQVLEDKQFGYVDNGAAANANDTLESGALYVGKDAVHHLVGGFAHSVFVLHHEGAR